MRYGLNAAPLAVFLLASGWGHAQVTIITPGSTVGQSTKSSEANYGPPRFIELETLELSVSDAGRPHVLTEGEIGPFIDSSVYWTVSKPGVRVLLIPAHDFDASDLEHAQGKRVQVRGIARFLRPKQYHSLPDGRRIDLDLIEDPSLPVLPPPRSDWPRLSITVFALKDRTYDETTKREPNKSGGVGQRILDDPASFVGKKSRIYGQFRGRNLFADLPEGSARTAGDWVLKDGATAMWVTGKEPKGQGWKLDPNYKGDTKSWMEVEGKPEVVNGVLYLKASFVTISKAPPDAKPEPSPR